MGFINVNNDDKVLLFGDNLTNEKFTYEDAICLSTGSYQFVIKDSYGDGLVIQNVTSPNYFEGYYSLTLDGEVIKTTCCGPDKDFDSGDQYAFEITPTPITTGPTRAPITTGPTPITRAPTTTGPTPGPTRAPNTTDPTPGPTRAPISTGPTPGPTQAPISPPPTSLTCDSSKEEKKLVITILTDYYPQDLSWKFINVNNDDDFLLSGANYTNYKFTYEDAICLSTGSYQFVIEDSWGDGLVIQDVTSSWYFEGYYSLTLDGEVIKTTCCGPDNDFDFGDQFAFEIGALPTPPPTLPLPTPPPSPPSSTPPPSP